MSSWLLRFWYQDKHPAVYLLYPLHLVLVLLIGLRKFIIIKRTGSKQKVRVPVIIVGNITVGGTGKSPLVIHLANGLINKGYNVGILSRGYGGNSTTYPLEVAADSSVSLVGDEPLMIKHNTSARVVVDPERNRGADFLENQCGCDLIICDDGLQHYRLKRDIEIIVVDGSRKFGNGLLMPFGPLREPCSRVKSVDALVINNGIAEQSTDTVQQFSMALENNHFIALSDTGKTYAVDDFLEHCKQQSEPIHAVAGIGNPDRFFHQLEKSGIKTINHSFEDHHQYSVDDFKDINGMIIMTEKDAVKCNSFNTENIWYLQVKAQVTPSIIDYCLDLLEQNKREN